MIKSDMRLEVRDLINNSDTTSSAAFSDATINRYLFEGVRFAQSKIEQEDRGFFEEVATGSLASGITTLALPTGFRELIDLRRVDNSRNIQFTKMDRREYSKYTPEVIISNGQYIYDIQKNSIIFLEPIQEAWDYRLDYTKNIADVLDSAEYDLTIPAQDFVIKRAAMLCLGGENNVPAFIQKLYAEAGELMIASITQRNRQKPRHVIVSRG